MHLLAATSSIVMSVSQVVARSCEGSLSSVFADAQIRHRLQGSSYNHYLRKAADEDVARINCLSRLLHELFRARRSQAPAQRLCKSPAKKNHFRNSCAYKMRRISGMGKEPVSIPPRRVTCLFDFGLQGRKRSVHVWAACARS